MNHKIIFAEHDDLINMPCPTSPRHSRMPRADRAAQFAPFAALTGYDAAIDETGRLKQIDEYEQLIILTDGKKIPIQEVHTIGSDLFRGMFD